MSERIEDMRLWSKAWLDTPFGTRHHFEAGRSPEAAAKLPGNAVKTRARKQGEFPDTGVLVEYGDSVLVRSHGDTDDGHWIWRGTQAEYHETWEVD